MSIGVRNSPPPGPWGGSGGARRGPWG